jgi:hypothetical protein
MSLHQSLFFILNTACLAKKQQIPFFIRLWFDTTSVGTHDLFHWDQHANNYTIDALSQIDMKTVIIPNLIP